MNEEFHIRDVLNVFFGGSSSIESHTGLPQYKLKAYLVRLYPCLMGIEMYKYEDAVEHIYRITGSLWWKIEKPTREQKQNLRPVHKYATLFAKIKTDIDDSAWYWYDSGGCQMYGYVICGPVVFDEGSYADSRYFKGFTPKEETVWLSFPAKEQEFQLGHWLIGGCFRLPKDTKNKFDYDEYLASLPEDYEA